jgi:hypothetical protein
MGNATEVFTGVDGVVAVLRGGEEPD